MIDAEKCEKVIRGLECCMRENNTNMCGDCPYHDSSETRFGCMQSAMRDALALLKEQEPVKPFGGYGFYFCGGCKNPFNSVSQKFCSECERRVKWGD